MEITQEAETGTSPEIVDVKHEIPHQRPGGSDPLEASYRALFAAFDDDASGQLSRQELVERLAKAGILEDDPRMRETLIAARKGDGSEGLDFAEFVSLIQNSSGLVRRVAEDNLVIPDFAEFAAEIDDIHRELLPETGGAVADYIPQLARVDPDQFAIAICTVDGQRHVVGDAHSRFCVQSVSKTVSYCLALEEHGPDKVHQHVGREPSGVSFNELTLNKKGRPHNPLINAGAIMSCALIRPDADLAERFDHVSKAWSRLAAGRPVGFHNSVYLSERETADRNFALGYSMREQRAFPEGTDLVQTLEFYFQNCAIELDAEMLAIVAATFADGGICPLTGERVFATQTVQHCLSLMSSCGMYDFSGEFAFSIGLPAKSGVSGALMVVVPGLMGICVWSPRLDEHGNSVRGIEFCRKLVERYSVHPHDSAEGQTVKRDLRRHKSQTNSEAVAILCWAAAEGDLHAIRVLAAAGADLSTANYDGRTPLHLAATEGQVNVVKYLLTRGVDATAVDRWGGTPLMDAERRGHDEVVALLRAADGARP
ncbi:glutaminase A [Allokutzneria sp. A3M-2-11 16]|uniref:glutaminase A n=1 Tax=Allokutzneria sp. A3M-2-11 16 TaxID=2962043 RepID=UPI0020B8F2E9|nr:glutaminase A [Allokutzneria sp. A3M-2-11 16]MCP3801784.1 glutaminase A [Allokutzneria sp. A3M-2-11 16]